MKVRDIMTSEGLATASLDTTLEEIAGMMRDENVGAIPVLDEDEELAGIITDRDIVVRAIADGQDPAETTAEDILSEELHTIHQDADIEDAADLMARHKIRRLPVVEEGMIIGMISLGDISVKSEEDQASDVLEDVSEGVKQSDGGSRKESRSVTRGGGRSEVGTGRAETRDSNQRANQGQATHGTTTRAGSGDSVFPASRRSSGEQVADEETRYQNQNARRNVQQGGSRAESANAGRIRNQSRSQQSVANDIVNVEGEEEFEFQSAGGGNARQRGNREQASARGRQNTSARGRESGQARGESARSQGVSNRTAGEERSRQQKVTPMRAEASHPGRNRNRKRAS